MNRRWILAVASAAALVGCASDPTRTALGTPRAQVLQQVGTPTATYPLPNGGERLQYSRAPMGFEVSNIDVDASGQVVSVRQELFEGLFGSTIKPGVWREADVLRTYGRPNEITRVTSFDGAVWSWRYKHINSRRLLYIYIGPDGVVDHYNTGDELTHELITR
jgi:hypothetical protein